MIEMINKMHGNRMYVDESRLDEYKEAGYKLASSLEKEIKEDKEVKNQEELEKEEVEKTEESEKIEVEQKKSKRPYTRKK